MLGRVELSEPRSGMWKGVGIHYVGVGWRRGCWEHRGLSMVSWVAFKWFWLSALDGDDAPGMPVVHGRCAYSRQNVVN